MWPCDNEVLVLLYMLLHFRHHGKKVVGSALPGPGAFLCACSSHVRGFSLCSPASSWSKDMHLGVSWWLWIDLWCERECEWLSVSIFSPCDELTTCLGHSAPLAPRQMGKAPAPWKTPLRDKAVDDGRMEAALPRLIPRSGTTWHPLSEQQQLASSALCSLQCLNKFKQQVPWWLFILTVD